MTRSHRKIPAALAAVFAMAWVALSIPGTAMAATQTAQPQPATATSAPDALPGNVFYAVNPYVSGAAVAPAAQPAFNFCNNTGGKVACFRSQIAFTSSTSYVLSQIALSDTNCDNRAVFAAVWDNVGVTRTGFIHGVPFTFENGHGCKVTQLFGTKSFVKPSHRVEFVYIKLFAANRTGNSTIVLSGRRTNPFTA
jgi:hypothetical protein